LNLSVFEKFTANVLAGKETKLEVSTSAKDILAADQPFQSVVSGLAEKSTLISCKRTIEHIVATITVRVDHQKSSSALVNSPNPSIFVRISVSIWTLAAFLACVFVGGLAVSIDTDLIRELSIWCQPATLALLVKGFGALLLAVAAFLAFRKLPAGER
jgi:hypothetical protein